MAGLLGSIGRGIGGLLGGIGKVGGMITSPLYQDISDPQARQRALLALSAGLTSGQGIGAAGLLGRQAVTEWENQQRAQKDDEMRRQLMEAQILKMRQPERERLVPVMRDGKIVYESESKAVGAEVGERTGTVADSAMIQEWKASGEPDYFKFLQRRSRMVNPPSAEPLISVQLPDGRTVLLPRSQAAGMSPPPPNKEVVPTEGERTSANYLGRMQAAEERLGDYNPTIRDYTAANQLMSGGAVRGSVANMILSNEGQQYYQAAADWVRAKLRKESGAVISPEEMAQEIKTYFPVPGDSQETIQQKKMARRQAMAGMQQMSGRATTPQVGGSRGFVDRMVPPSGQTPGFPSASAIDAEIARRRGGR